MTNLSFWSDFTQTSHLKQESEPLFRHQEGWHPVLVKNKFRCGVPPQTTLSNGTPPLTCVSSTPKMARECFICTRNNPLHATSFWSKCSLRRQIMHQNTVNVPRRDTVRCVALIITLWGQCQSCRRPDKTGGGGGRDDSWDMLHRGNCLVGKSSCLVVTKMLTSRLTTAHGIGFGYFVQLHVEHWSQIFEPYPRIVRKCSLILRQNRFQLSCLNLQTW